MKLMAFRIIKCCDGFVDQILFHLENSSDESTTKQAHEAVEYKYKTKIQGSQNHCR